jgi:CO/xanthine dehydrogenase Mo-binding subunit
VVANGFPSATGPTAGMSIGEPPVLIAAAAVSNAVHDAVGVRIYDLPITAEKVLRALRAEREQWSDGVMGN